MVTNPRLYSRKRPFDYPGYGQDFISFCGSVDIIRLDVVVLLAQMRHCLKCCWQKHYIAKKMNQSSFQSQYFCKMNTYSYKKETNTLTRYFAFFQCMKHDCIWRKIYVNLLKHLYVFRKSWIRIKEIYFILFSALLHLLGKGHKIKENFPTFWCTLRVSWTQIRRLKGKA